MEGWLVICLFVMMKPFIRINSYIHNLNNIMLLESTYITFSFQPTKTLAWEEFKTHPLYHRNSKFIIVWDTEQWNIYELTMC